MAPVGLLTFRRSRKCKETSCRCTLHWLTPRLLTRFVETSLDSAEFSERINNTTVFLNIVVRRESLPPALGTSISSDSSGGPRINITDEKEQEKPPHDGTEIHQMTQTLDRARNAILAMHELHPSHYNLWRIKAGPPTARRRRTAYELVKELANMGTCACGYVRRDTCDQLVDTNDLV